MCGRSAKGGSSGSSKEVRGGAGADDVSGDCRSARSWEDGSGETPSEDDGLVVVMRFGAGVAGAPVSGGGGPAARVAPGAGDLPIRSKATRRRSARPAGGGGVRVEAARNPGWSGEGDLSARICVT